MRTIENMVMIISMVDKSVADAVAAKLHDTTDSRITIFYGTGHTDKKGFLGIQLNDEVVEIICVVEKAEVDHVINEISETGRMEELGRGYIVTVPFVTMMVPYSTE